MKTPNFLVQSPVDVPNRSGFAMPHEYMTSGRCGTLYPVLCKPFVPNETVSDQIMFECELPPMVSNFFGRIDICFEAFWVPNYLLWGGWDYFFTHPTENPIYPEGTPAAVKPHNIPHIRPGINQFVSELMGRNTLGDFLGCKYNGAYGGNNVGTPVSVSVLPFLAYHRAYHDHYRNNVVQAPVFYTPDGSVPAPYAATLPYVTGVNSQITEGDNVRDIFLNNAALPNSPLLGDGVRLTSLRQANWDLDYFTAATPAAQAGGAATITFDVATNPDTGDGTGSFSISSLRSANAIQIWMERNNLVGYDYGDQNYVQYGAYPKRQLDKCIYLGRYSEPVYNRSVFQTSQDGENGNTSRNPFGGVAAKFGSSAANGKGMLFDNFKCTDHGYLLVLMSLRPYAYYSTGCERHLTARHIGDIPFPLLSSVGDQPIYNYELMGLGVDTARDEIAKSVFGWIDQYAHAKTVNDSVHGELRDGGLLDSFVLQRSFDPADGKVEISDSFLEIPQDYLDQVKEVQNSLVPIDYWISVYHNLNKISPLPLYSVPTLGRLPNTHTEFVSRKKSTI